MKKGIVIGLLLLLSLSIQAKNEPWEATWISTEECQSATNTWLMYRKDFKLNTIPDRLIAKIAAETKYWLWINDRLVVFEGGLKRGPSPHGTYYDSVNIEKYLTSGNNTIAILVWHFGKDGFSHNNSGKAGLLFEAKTDELKIISDSSWTCSVSKAYKNTEAPYPNYRLPESNIRFDARNAIEGWNLKSFKGRLAPSVEIAKASEAPFGTLTHRPIPLWKDYGLKHYKPTIRQSGDTIFCPLPYNSQITPYLKIESKAGEKISIQTDNYVGGGVNNLRAEYITKDGIQEYESLGWLNGSTVIYVIPKNVTVLDLMYRETGYDTDFTGAFYCNDAFFNELWKRSSRTLYITMRDTFMDCPDRERAQWWGDEVNELGEIFYALSPSSQHLVLKGIYELMNWQKESGILYSPVPAGNWDKELPIQMLASIGWYGFYTFYYYSADDSFIKDVYPGMHKYLHQLFSFYPNGLVKERKGAWPWGDWGENVDMELLTNCWYYLALKAEKAFAAQLGITDDVQSISLQMEKMKESFDGHFWTGGAFRSPNYTGKTDDRSQAMAILSELATPNKYPQLLHIFKTESHASPYMEKYVLEALFKMDEPSFALQRMKKKYTQMLSYKEHTTLFEGWDVGTKGYGGGTINHAWSGGPLTLLSQCVCGVSPTSPAFKSFQIKPQLGNLNEASATVPTRYGNINVCITKTKRKTNFKIEVPMDTKAELIYQKHRIKLNSGQHILSL